MTRFIMRFVQFGGIGDVCHTFINFVCDVYSSIIILLNDPEFVFIWVKMCKTLHRHQIPLLLRQIESDTFFMEHSNKRRIF